MHYNTQREHEQLKKETYIKKMHTSSENGRGIAERIRHKKG
jgi:hypothetical protein